MAPRSDLKNHLRPRKLTDDHIEWLRQIADDERASALVKPMGEREWLKAQALADTALAAPDGPLPRPGRRPGKQVTSTAYPLPKSEIIGREFQDSIVRGLRIFIGPTRTVWRFRRRGEGGRTTKGTRARTITFRTLGEFPTVKCDRARELAEIEVGKVHTGEAVPSKRSSIKFEAAFDAYVEYLKAKAEKNGKPARWAYNVQKLGAAVILPRWAGWTLYDMAMSPDAVADWHKKVTRDHGPVSANHAARIVRAAYKRVGRRDRSLPAYLPTSAVEFNSERPSQKALSFKSFPDWLRAWRKIDNAIRQAYHLCALLIGSRPGELARLRWDAYSDNERTLVIAKAKAGNDIIIPVTDEISAALKMARAAAEALGYDIRPDALIFPGCTQAAWRDNLPARGNMLRHTYSTVAADLGVGDLIRHFLMGHAPEGISQKYIASLILANGPKMREEQSRISRRILELLGLNARTLKGEMVAGLAQSAAAGELRVENAAKVLARAQRVSAIARRGGASRSRPGA
ncbi:hypothetical protein L6654_24225 [Bradyrhizobium sp. WYCCWR 13023]|uniref:Tyr recombinase domain-containing protein n=1 Tax=Bradyrhizobium zhengyangense TaxID=2911009 RepID=A0A9X1RDQ2_9BRAD|nr:hypothetical protein [Bradyrhizobium zhengyangense]MCG2629735.1 hypothetical protein [Bradyrhizobium zhengyangense]